MDAINFAVFPRENPWLSEEEIEKDAGLRKEAIDVIQTIPHECAGVMSVEGLLPYERIIDIDTNADSVFPGNIVYIEFTKDNLFGISATADIETADDEIDIDDPSAKRIKYFPDKFRDPTD